MRYAFLITIVLSFAILSINTLVEMSDSGINTASFRSVYKEDASVLFFLDQNSSFYHSYSFKEEPPYLTERKMGHFIAYGTLAAIIFFILPIDNIWRRGMLAFGSASLIGLIDEFHQHFLINRSGRVLDVFVNAAGSFVSVMILAFILIVFSFVKRLFFVNKNKGHKKSA